MDKRAILTIAGEEFKTKKSLHERARAEVAPYKENDTVFESPFLSILIHERHYFCRKLSTPPLKFQHRREVRKNFWMWSMYGYWEDPQFSGWSDVSWWKAVKGDVSDYSHALTAMRDHTQSFLHWRVKEYPICELCHEGPSKEVDHVAPTFKEIEERLFEVYPPEVIAEGFDWTTQADFRLAPHVADLLVELHEGAVIQALCKPCHLKKSGNETRERFRKLREQAA